MLKVIPGLRFRIKEFAILTKDSAKINVPPEVSNWAYGQVNDILPMKREVFIGTEEHGIIEIHYGTAPAQ